MKRNLVMFTSEDCTSLVPASVSEFKRHIGDFGPQVKVTVTIEHYRRPKSLKQMGLVHKYLSKMAEHLGHDMEDMKVEMKRRFGARKDMMDRNDNLIYDEETGEVLQVIKSLKEYDTGEMTVFIDRIRKFSHEVMKYYLPTPEELKQYNLQW